MLLSSYLVIYLFVSKYDSALRKIIRTHFYLNLVAGKNLNIMHTHLTGNMGCDLMPIFQLYPEHCIAQGFNNYTVLFDC